MKLKNFEIEVIKLLTQDVFTQSQISQIVDDLIFISYEFTGAGYFLTFEHSLIPQNRFTCHRPILLGKSENGITCGFVIFISNNQLTIECHDWGESNVTENFRNENIQIFETVL